MSFISEAQGAIDTAAHFTTLEDRISKLEQDLKNMENRMIPVEQQLNLNQPQKSIEEQKRDAKKDYSPR